MVQAGAIALIGLIIVAAGLFVWAHPSLLTPTNAQMRLAFPGQMRQILEHSSQFTLLSLEPEPTLPTATGSGPPNDKLLFHGYSILGRLQISDPKQKQELLRALDDGIARCRAEDACFNPRHGIHAEAGNHSVDLVNCFHCQQFELYSGRQKSLAGVSNAPQKTFARILSDAGIPLAQH